METKFKVGDRIWHKRLPYRFDYILTINKITKTGTVDWKTYRKGVYHMTFDDGQTHNETVECIDYNYVLDTPAGQVLFGYIKRKD
jgi:signal peptidase I